MQISEFSKEEIEEFHQHDKNAFWEEYEFYKELDKSRREIQGLFLEINNAYGNWRFMDGVLPSLFGELYEVFMNTLKKIKKGIKEINYELWEDTEWDYLSKYKELQNEESTHYYLFEYLVSEFKEAFILNERLSDHYSKNRYDKVLRKSKIRILNIFYYFHQKSIRECKRKAETSFLENIREKLQGLGLPLLTYSDSLLYELNLNYCTNKVKDLFQPSYRNITYKLGLEPIWEDEVTGISIYYFDEVKDPFFLLTNQKNNLYESIKQSGEEVLFHEWFHTPKVKEEIVSHYFHPIYYKYLRKRVLSPEDINKSKKKIHHAYLKLKEYFGISSSLSELIKIFRNEQEGLIEIETSRHPPNIGDFYDSDMDIEGHSYYILNSIFPIISIFWTKYKKVKKPKEIAIVDLETTGDNFYSDSIIEIGICKLNLTTGAIEPLFNKVCCEKGKEIPHEAWIFRHSDLDYFDVVNAPDISQFRREIQHIFNTYPITSYPQNFDFAFLKLRGFKIRKKFWDPLVKLQYLLKIPRYNGDYKWPSIQEAWYYFFPNSDYKVSHRALDDAYHEAQIIYEYYKKMNKKESEKNSC